MVQQRSSVIGVREELRDLDGQRRAIEEEIALLSGRLNSPGQPGIKGSLLDKEVSSEVLGNGVTACGFWGGPTARSE